MVNKKRLIGLAQRLIRIDSQNPPGDESRIACFVKKYLDDLGLETRAYLFKKGRSNLVAKLGSKQNRHSLLITPHLDTVPAGKNWRYQPFAAKIKAGKIFGLGATDCKGNLACALEAINSIVEERIRLDYNLVLAATADEESGSQLGLVPLVQKGLLKADAALVLDSDDFGIVVTQKGLLHLKIKIQGRRAHGAYPHEGINAIDIAMEVIRRIKQAGFSFRKNKYLKAPTVNIGTIRGGDKVNVVADWCECELDFRFLPGTDGRELLKRIKKIIATVTHKFDIEIESIQPPYYISEKHPLVKGLESALRKFKIKPKITGSEGATVITFFQDKSIPAVSCGFGSSGCAHSADEYAKIASLYKGAQVLEEFLKNYRFA